MAIATTQVYTTVTLRLSGDEADYLKELLQNPVSPEPEMSKLKEMRESIWTAIHEALLSNNHSNLPRRQAA